MEHQIHNSAINVINSLREELVGLVENCDADILAKKTEDYKLAIEQYYLSTDKDELSREDIQNLRELIFHHNDLILVAMDKKKKIKTDLKQLRMGNEMKQTYPQNI